MSMDKLNTDIIIQVINYTAVKIREQQICGSTNIQTCVCKNIFNILKEQEKCRVD